MSALDYLKQVVPPDLIPRMKVQGFLRAATISLIMDRFDLSVEEAFETVYQLTGQVPEKTKIIRIGEFYMKGGILTKNRAEATKYSFEETQMIREKATEEVQKRMIVV